jgi:beta-N-acetylhexosaminidase
MAQELRQLGINTNMVPVLDVLHPATHEIISSRAYGDRPQQVIELGQAVAQGHLAGGVLPVMKHIPGHGRARADSHVELPVVDTCHAELQNLDFKPFERLSDLPAAMTAHVVYSDLDADHPASTSKIIHDQIIRGEMGFDGLLMSDDLSMKALKGTFAQRAQAVFTAGSDIALHCNGHMDEMEDVASVSPPLAGRAQRRYLAALAVTKHAQAVDICAAEAAIDESLSVTP